MYNVKKRLQFNNFVTVFDIYKMKKINTNTETDNYDRIILKTGESVTKNHPVVKCLYQIEMLDSSIAISFKYLDNYKCIFRSLIKIQNKLSLIKDEISTHPRMWCDDNLNFLQSEDVVDIQKLCDNIDIEDDTYQKCGEASAYFDYISKICNNCESVIYDLDDNIHQADVSKHIKMYLNNLSKYLYLIARKIGI